MLRITVHDNPQALTFQLEGRLAGPWLRELQECWKNTLARHRKPILRVDLTEVTFIDDAGKACLAAMYCQGAELVAADCLTKALWPRFSTSVSNSKTEFSCFAKPPPVTRPHEAYFPSHFYDLT